MSLEELLDAADRLNGAELDRLFERILVLRARRKAPVLREEEAKLLQQINNALPSDLHKRYQALVEKRDLETLTEVEQNELLELSDRIEVLAAKRAEALVKLAELRQKPLFQLMDDLGIHAPSYA